MQIVDTLEVDALSPVDRDEVGTVGQILCDRGYIGEVNMGRDRKAVLKLYPCYDADFWTLDYDEFLEALVKARERAFPPWILRIFQGVDGRRDLLLPTAAVKLM